MKSAIYQGIVTHHRLSPKQHYFKYRLFMLYLDLDELENVFDNIPFWSSKRRSLAYFKRSDYLRPAQRPLKDCVRKVIFDHCQVKHTGPIRMLTHLRTFGFCFNPVTFYYCFNTNDTKLEFVIAEITNTPWNERHQYFLDLRKANFQKFSKCFHISPFMDMDMKYNWQFSKPGEDIKVDMLVFQEQCHLQVSLKLQRKNITKRNMLSLLIKSGLINYKVLLGIYWQAAKLYIKRTPFYSHPKYRKNDQYNN